MGIKDFNNNTKQIRRKKCLLRKITLENKSENDTMHPLFEPPGYRNDFFFCYKASS